MKHAAEILAEFAVNLRFDDLPSPVVDRTKQLILDTVAASILGGRMPWSAAIRETALLPGPKGKSSIIGVGETTSANAAAFVNGSYAHANDFDDFYAYGPLHPSQAVWVTLPMAEETGASGIDAITNVVIGYEISARIAEACFSNSKREKALVERGLHAQPAVGVLAAAAQACVLMGQPADVAASAMGVAGSYAGGLMQFMEEPADTKRFHFGKASCDGITSAQLASRGFRGPKSVLEGKKGLLNAIAGEWVSEKLTGNLGSTFGVMSAFLKPVPTMGGNFGCYEALATIVENHHIRPEDIESITAEMRSQFAGYSIGIGEKAIEAHYAPPDRYSAEMSLPYLMGLVAFHGRDIRPQHFDIAERTRKDLVSFVRRVRINFPADIDAVSRLDAFAMGRVTVVLRNGKTHTETVRVSTGDPRKPLSWDLLKHKLSVCAQDALSQDDMSELLERVKGLEKEKGTGFVGEILRRARMDIWPGEQAA